jgi:hypothetical protein
MSFWKKRGGAIAIGRAVADQPAMAERVTNAGDYHLLYKFLRDRYANRVVLTFAEIEDLLGFALPNSARIQQEWWAGGDPFAAGSAQSDSWMLASRTATVNLVAQSVVFDRETSSESHLEGR